MPKDGNARRWTGPAAMWLGLIALTAIVLGFILDERLFGSDPYKTSAYAYGGGVACLSALAIVFGIDGWALGPEQVRAPATAGVALGIVALAACALFLFGTMLVGG